ncbi:TetR/AcrR family transcriptional regulator [Corynebacterium pelargi]|uniref:Division inhibitor protein n=1 Tax=Corynebacterium pelargi TaxID=1471400 RepID=A0A410W8K7_9CORY|nr:TetR/AcrR family transcriptional regulator [Corynebacterium pelargi]QAU52279.1 division inhibitor protein [Corynebacterium pelargi]GGG68849.1 transcriptional regulator [Corynebacterium pelargi]
MRIDAQRRRSNILAAGARLLLRQGDAMTLEAVAKRAGVGIATVYRHFPTRAALVDQILLDIAVQGISDLEQLVELEPKTAAEGEAMLSRLLTLINTIGLNAVIPTLLSAEEHELNQASLDARARLLELLTQVVQELKAVEVIHPSIEALAFYNGIVRLLGSHDGGVHSDLEADQQDLLNIFLAGCRHGVAAKAVQS